jgi:hypothetical protein
MVSKTATCSMSPSSVVEEHASSRCRSATGACCGLLQSAAGAVVSRAAYRRAAGELHAVEDAPALCPRKCELRQQNRRRGGRRGAGRLRARSAPNTTRLTTSPAASCHARSKHLSPQGTDHLRVPPRCHTESAVRPSQSAVQARLRTQPRCGHWNSSRPSPRDRMQEVLRTRAVVSGSVRCWGSGSFQRAGTKPPHTAPSASTTHEPPRHHFRRQWAASSDKVPFKPAR